MGSVDIAAAEAFSNAKPNKLKYGEHKLQEPVLEGTSKYLEPLVLDDDEEKTQRLQGKASWILFKKNAEPAKALTKVTTDSAPNGVFLSERSSRKINGAADKSAVVAALQSFRTKYPVGAEPVDVLQLAGRNFVIATRRAHAHEMMLPPRAPKQSHVLERSDRPSAAQMKVSFVRKREQAMGTIDHTCKTTMRTVTYFLNPEFKCQRKTKPRPQPRRQRNQKATATVGEANGEGDAQSWKRKDWSMTQARRNGSGDHRARKPCIHFGLCGG